MRSASRETPASSGRWAELEVLLRSAGMELFEVGPWGGRREQPQTLIHTYITTKSDGLETRPNGVGIYS
jgi:hypothetical protein